jgi:hypothetical protein
MARADQGDLRIVIDQVPRLREAGRRAVLEMVRTAVKEA